MSAAALLRSLLFVPGDSERKQVKGLGGDADALILDLEDSVAPALLPKARSQVGELLKAHRQRSKLLYVRINPLSSGLSADDLAAVMPGAPDGLMIPKISDPAELVDLERQLETLERRHGMASGSTSLIVIATETPQALLTMRGYIAPSARLRGLTWGHEDLAAALGASAKREADGSLSFPYQIARSMCLITACAAGVQPIDGVFVDFRDPAGLERETQVARRDGFTAKLAIHPDQVPIINASIVPSPQEVQHSRQLIAAFEADPSLGVVAIDGKMVDRAHLAQARRIVATGERRRL